MEKIVKKILKLVLFEILNDIQTHRVIVLSHHHFSSH
jgi:hypothetical protein